MLVPFPVLLTLPATRQLFSHPDLWTPHERCYSSHGHLNEGMRWGKQTGTQRTNWTRHVFYPSRIQGTIWHDCYRSLLHPFSMRVISSSTSLWACLTSVPMQTSEFAWVGYLWVQLHLNHPCTCIKVQDINPLHSLLWLPTKAV